MLQANKIGEFFAESAFESKTEPAQKKRVIPVTNDRISAIGLEVAEVSGILEDGTPVCALVTAESFTKLGIGEGNCFIFMFKAMSVILS